MIMRLENSGGVSLNRSKFDAWYFEGAGNNLLLGRGHTHLHLRRERALPDRIVYKGNDAFLHPQTNNTAVEQTLMHLLGYLEKSGRNVYHTAGYNHVRGDVVLVFISSERHDVLFSGGLERAETRCIGIRDEDIAPLFNEGESCLLGSPHIFPVADIRHGDLKI